MLEAPIKKELKSQTGYDVYFKQLSAYTKQLLSLKLIDPHLRNTLLTDIACCLSLKEELDDPADITKQMTVIAEGPYKALQTFQGAKEILHKARSLHCYTLNHLTFYTFTHHRGNSFILVHCPSLPSIPAQIDSILQIPTETYFVV